MKQLFYYAATLVCMLVAIMSWQHKTIENLQRDQQRQEANTIALMEDVQHYKTADSLNVAKALALSVTLDEYKQYRADDLREIGNLKIKARELSAVTKVQTKTSSPISSLIREKIVYRDSLITDTLNCIDIDDEFFSMHGCLDDNKFDGEYIVYDSLIVVETTKYKRFLGFLWKTKQIKDRRVDVFSKNPNTYINDVEHIYINK